MPRINL